MEDKELQTNIQNQTREQQVKLRYYIIALCVTAIGFSIYKTTNKEISILMIPLALAVISWAICIYLGFQYLKILMSVLIDNSTLFDIKNGVHHITKNNPEKIKVGYESLWNIADKKASKAGKIANWQEKLLYVGVLFFLIWHILEMINYVPIK